MTILRVEFSPASIAREHTPSKSFVAVAFADKRTRARDKTRCANTTSTPRYYARICVRAEIRPSGGVLDAYGVKVGQVYLLGTDGA